MTSTPYMLLPFIGGALIMLSSKKTYNRGKE
jgi:hypothetical protein